MDKEMYDDGLVHSHYGHSTSNTPARPARPDPGFDDGIDHQHGWACTERGAQAHR